MAARVIHVGEDNCHRRPVLESAGYEVDTCTSVPELRDALATDRQPDAVLISEGIGGPHQDAISEKAVSLTRSLSLAPVILFRETQRQLAESDFDLVIPILVPPQTWLTEIAALITRCRALQAEAQALCSKSAGLRRESAAIRAKSSGERQRSRQEYAKKAASPGGWVKGPGSNSGPETDD